MRTKIVMFIDDDESFQDYAETACKKIGAIKATMRAADGEDGLRKLEVKLRDQQPIPEVIFVDINMPRMDGFDFLKGFAVMRKRYPEVLASVKPIAMLTSSDQDSDRQRALGLGADSYLVKPSSLVEMRAVISAAIL